MCFVVIAGRRIIFSFPFTLLQCVRIVMAILKKMAAVLLIMLRIDIVSLFVMANGKRILNSEWFHGPKLLLREKVRRKWRSCNYERPRTQTSVIFLLEIISNKYDHKCLEFSIKCFLIFGTIFEQSVFHKYSRCKVSGIWYWYFRIIRTTHRKRLVRM